MEVALAVSSATCAVDAVAGAVVGTAFVRRRMDGEYGLTALLSIAALAHGAGSIGAHLAIDPGARAAFHVLSLAGAAIALPFAALVALATRPGRLAGWARPAAFGATAIAVLADTAHLLAVHHGTSLGAVIGELGASHISPVEGVALRLLAVAASVIVVLAVAQLRFAGQRATAPMLAASAVLFGAAAHDAGMACGVIAAGVPWIDAGLACLLAAVATTPSAKYALVADELDRCTQELRTRTRELRRSYEDLRTAQEELVKKEQLAVVGELAAVIAHEVRNPLAIIANAGAGLRKQGIKRDDYEVLLAILDEETSRLNRLVTDLLRYARPVSLQRQQFPLSELLERALSLPDRSNDVQLDLKLEVHDARIWGDSNLLRQVFENLIDNALQAMGTGGNLTVRVRAASRDGTDGLDVAFIDTGEGMDTQVRSRALDPFFTTRPSGTGLGLAIVDRIIEAHGGRLDIDSRAGEGTTVTVFLPHGSPSEPPPSRRSNRPPPPDPRRRPSLAPSPPLPRGGRVPDLSGE